MFVQENVNLGIKTKVCNKIDSLIKEGEDFQGVHLDDGTVRYYIGKITLQEKNTNRKPLGKDKGKVDQEYLVEVMGEVVIKGILAEGMYRSYITHTMQKQIKNKMVLRYLSS